MLSYQHIYHAGNFADVHKHILQIAVLQSLQKNGQNIFYIDTHAGRGVYNLDSREALKTCEFENGILQCATTTNKTIRTYFDIIRSLNKKGELTYYPGSAKIAHKLLSLTDRCVFTELHPAEFKELEYHFKNAKNVTSAKADGIESLLSYVPPHEPLGMAVIDPSYEIKKEYENIPLQLATVWKKWPSGVYFLWFPILEKPYHETLLKSLRERAIKNVLISTIILKKPPARGFAMRGTGVAIINPPQQLEEIEALTEETAHILYPDADTNTFWL